MTSTLSHTPPTLATSPVYPDIDNWIENAGTFTAHIHCHGVKKQWSDLLQLYTPVRCLPGTSCDIAFPVNLSTGGSSLDNWLIIDNRKQPATFKFEFHSRTTDRLYVRIHGTGTDQDKQVDISRNGYLGLYANASELLKLEPLEWTANTLRCRIRDHQGHAVKVAYENPTYLNVQNGDEVSFVITRL
ncbi:hypothetical protein [Pseudomonas sp. RIT623]|uniref:hypothetical protein n=1 Tax=Pseudomonas sp. RIT623 TaxID=2559075 RepID=UPI0010702047|nr:hypothetical protein [Pseudomonas sp. RIT623]TFF39057.1 hypothetical protein E3U47_14875 [Pseudomonas sp. RIT623]